MEISQKRGNDGREKPARGGIWPREIIVELCRAKKMARQNALPRHLDNYFALLLLFENTQADGSKLVSTNGGRIYVNMQ